MLLPKQHTRKIEKIKNGKNGKNSEEKIPQLTKKQKQQVQVQSSLLVQKQLFKRELNLFHMGFLMIRMI